MPNDAPSDEEQAKRARIGREHLTKALVKALPVVGDVVNEMVFETRKDEASAKDKEKLTAALNAIQSQQVGATTDLGDVLNKLDLQQFEMQALRTAIVEFTTYVQGSADEATISRVEAAAIRALPGYSPGADTSGEIGTLDQFTLRTAIGRQLQPAEWEIVLSDIPGGAQAVYGASGMQLQIAKLLTWAAGASGPGLNRIYTYIKRAYPSFTLPP
jgi:hypothetical protein